MKIFGIEFKTKKELKTELAVLQSELKAIREVFPFTFGQIVYDVQLKNDKGRYAKKNASFEHSKINEVVVDQKNYFGLVERYRRNDVFTSRESADAYLREVCTKHS